MIRIETDRLIIRTPELTDAPAINAGILESIDELKEYLFWAQNAPTIEETSANLAETIEHTNARNDIRLLMFTKCGEFIGSSGIHRIDWRIPKGEVGYWIRSSMTGHGFASEAVGAIIRHSMFEMDFNRIEIFISGKNTKSHRVPEKLGIKLEAILRNDRVNPDGIIDDTYIYSITEKISASTIQRRTVI